MAVIKDTPKCIGTTKLGYPCGAYARKGSQFCAKHQDQDPDFLPVDDDGFFESDVIGRLEDAGMIKNQTHGEILGALGEVLDSPQDPDGPFELMSYDEALDLVQKIARADESVYEKKVLGGDGMTADVPPSTRDRLAALRILMPHLDQHTEREQALTAGTKVMTIAGMSDLSSQFLEEE